MFVFMYLINYLANNNLGDEGFNQLNKFKRETLTEICFENCQISDVMSLEKMNTKSLVSLVFGKNLEN